MGTRWLVLLALGVLLVFPAPGRAGDAEKAKKLVEDHLTKLNARSPHVERLDDKALTAAFPGRQFFAVRFRQWPVGIAPPQGLKPSNVVAVGKDDKLTALTDAKELEDFFLKQLPPAKGAAYDAAASWLLLARELVQDGFYKFGPVGSLSNKAAAAADGKLMFQVASGKTVVMGGGSGEIGATLEFDGDGKLTKITQRVNVKRGPRPRCHATLLLHPDPLVRQIVEDDLLIMGRAARDYLMEQRARANPELQQAIDRLWQRILREDP
jgi:hypothetical protein